MRHKYIAFPLLHTHPYHKQPQPFALPQQLQVILDPTSYPLMVMCNLGRHRTGVRGCMLSGIVDTCVMGDSSHCRHTGRMSPQTATVEPDEHL